METKTISPRTGMDVESLAMDIRNHMRYTLAKDNFSANDWDRYRSLVLSVLDRLHDKWILTQQKYYEKDVKRVYYISMEFLIGRQLDNALLNLGIKEEVKKALEEVGFNYDELRDAEWDAGLGNGGLGRLAACFLDSMATMGLPGYGYGIRYDYGIFYQKIIDGFQVESPDMWLRFGNPWDIVRPKLTYPINFYGEVVSKTDASGKLHFEWRNTEKVIAVAYDTPVPGFNNDVVNNLRLWKASASKSIDLHVFNQGDYVNAIRDIELQENISRVLYPNDKVFVGMELRLKQEYFLVSATLQDIIRRFKKQYSDFRLLPDKVAIQCNDTHPNLAIPELMRILVDIEGLDWDTSWDITTRTIAYTNHTILPEALEKWPVTLLRTLLPRHLQIIFEINNRFLGNVRTHFGEDVNRIRRMSIIGEGEQPMVQMANLGIVGSHKVNGVSALHTDLLKKTIFKDFHEMWPNKFVNMTNGITQRRWLNQCNPKLSSLINETVGSDWYYDLSTLVQLEPHANKAAFRKKFASVKHANKVVLASYIKEKYNIDLNLDSIFDIQIKRMHEYKRQLMAIFHAITLYNRIKASPNAPFQPRTIIFGGKAAPGYAMAKLHIKLINDVAEVINNDPVVGNKLKVVFMANYSVTLAEMLIPAAELSEQISTAGMEASGTGNMKFALNGALTIGTMDGANVEMSEEIGEENMFIFGLNVDGVANLRQSGYNPHDVYNSNAELKLVIDQLQSGYFNPDKTDLYHAIVHALMSEGDYFLVMADFDDYLRAQADVEKLYADSEKWNKMAILNVARVGKFSSDRTIGDYAREIWNTKPV
jgi:glycogen phosphorylase